MEFKVKISRAVLTNSPESLADFDFAAFSEKFIPNTKSDAKYLAKETKRFAKMAANIKKYYPNGIVVPTVEALDAANALPAGTKEEQKIRDKAINEAEKALDVYYKTMRPYLDAEELVKRFAISKEIMPHMRERCAAIKEEVSC